MPEVILKRIGHESAFHPYPRLALVVKPLLGEREFHDLIEEFVVRELNVAADIPGEALLINKRPGEAAGLAFPLEKFEPLVVEPLEPEGGAETRRAPAKNQNPIRH